jgi:hypothetical protein
LSALSLFDGRAFVREGFCPTLIWSSVLTCMCLCVSLSDSTHEANNFYVRWTSVKHLMYMIKS